MPLMRCAKLSAVRSAIMMAAAEPLTAAITSPGRSGEPSGRRAQASSVGSTRRKTASATSAPASTPSDLATMTAPACSSGGMSASQVGSPIDRSSLSARSMSDSISGVM